MEAFRLDDFETVLTTTRAVRRRLNLDRPVSRAIVEECLDLALQAPTGGSAEDWRFVAVDDPELIRAVGALYREAYEAEVAEVVRHGTDAPKARGRLPEAADPAAAARLRRILDGAEYLAGVMERMPMLLVACATRPHPDRGAAGTVSAVYGSVYPAVWSFMLALRARGLGSLITTLHLHRAEAVARLLGIPEGATQVCLLPVAYTVGTDFRRGRRDGR